MLYGARQLLNSSFSILCFKKKKHTHIYEFGNMKVGAKKTNESLLIFPCKVRKCPTKTMWLNGLMLWHWAKKIIFDVVSKPLTGSICDGVDHQIWIHTRYIVTLAKLITYCLHAHSSLIIYEKKDAIICPLSSHFIDYAFFRLLRYV